MPGNKTHSEHHAQSEWEEPENAKSLKSDLQVPGRGLGHINASQFETATWLSHIKLPRGQEQFGKFVDVMMNRIRFEESNPEEVRQFVKLIASDKDWTFLRVAVPHIPELKLEHLHENDNKNFQLALLFQQLKSKMHQRSFEEIKVNTRGGYCRQPMPKPLSHTLPSSKGLTKAEQAYVEQSLFVHYPAPMRTPAMNRVLEGTLALGWPLPALHRQRQDALNYGIQVDRDSEGLPMCMLMPGQPRCRGIRLLQNHTPAPTAYRSDAWSTNAAPNVIKAASTTSLSGENDSPPCELLTEADNVANARPSFGRGKGKMVHSNVPKVMVTSASPSSAVCRTNIHGELSNSKVASRKTTSPELEYLQNLPAVPYKAPSNGPIYPNIPPEPTVVLDVPKQDQYGYAFHQARNEPAFVRLCDQITRTHQISKTLEADAKAKRR